MKRKIILTLMLSMAFITNAQKHDIKSFTKADNGVTYQIQKINPEGQRVKEGDLVIGKFAIYYGDSLVYNKLNRPSEPIFPVLAKNQVFKGDLIDGLKMMHVGDVTTFAFPTDSMTKHNTGVPKTLKADYVFYQVEVDSVASLAEVERKERAMADSLLKVEYESIMDYLAKENWDKTPIDGVFIKHLNNGTGAKIKDGDKVKMHYVGQLLNGTVFDCSLEDVAKANNMYVEQRKYEPLEFTVGEGRLIRGFEAAAKQMKKGGKAIVLIPSESAYGARDMGVIKPFSPLLFTLEVVDVTKGQPATNKTATKNKSNKTK